MPDIPTPLDVPWTLKSTESAKTWVRRLPDGRMEYGIEHALIRGVRPAMIVWFLNHMTDLVEVGGHTVQRYRLWHPIDHIRMTYLRPAHDGRAFGAGARVRIQEAFQANPKTLVDIQAHIEFLDETGFAHHERFAGLRAARMEYHFTETPEGTLYKNSLVIGVEGRSPLAWFMNTFVAPRVFPAEKGKAWIQHNVEEVGALESFLPEHYAARDTPPSPENTP